MRRFKSKKARLFKKFIKKLLKIGATLWADIEVKDRRKGYKYYVDFIRFPTPTLKKKPKWWIEEEKIKKKLEAKRIDNIKTNE